MNDIFFLDTNIILDYLENRNEDIKNIINLMIKYSADKLTLATSIFNIAEVIDSEYDINFHRYCKYKKRMGDHEIRNKKGDTCFYKEVTGKSKLKIEKNLAKFKNKTNLAIFNDVCNEELSELVFQLYTNCLESQDAVIVSSARYNGANYLLTNDQKLIDSLGAPNWVFNLSKQKGRADFIRELMNLGYKLD